MCKNVDFNLRNKKTQWYDILFKKYCKTTVKSENRVPTLTCHNLAYIWPKRNCQTSFCSKYNQVLKYTKHLHT